MSRSPFFDRLARTIRIAHYCEERKISTGEGLARLAEAEAREAKRGQTRRELLADVGKVAAVGAAATIAGPLKAFARPPSAGLDVGIVGAGLAGLASFDRLMKAGTTPFLYEASTRVGGRCFSMSQANPAPGNIFFPGQVGERGGEFIDNLHRTMLGYATELGLTKEDYFDIPGEVFYRFGGVTRSEAEVVDIYRQFAPIINDDVRRLSSSSLTAFAHSPQDEAIDNTSLAGYLDGQNAAGEPFDPVLAAALGEAYRGEYGLDPEEQSTLNFILFIASNRSSKLKLFGNQSNERWHVREGNEEIPRRLAGRKLGLVHESTGAVLDTQHLKTGWRLIHARNNGSKIALTFDAGGKTKTVEHTFVVITIPFSVLRGVTLDANLGIGANLNQLEAIQSLGYGTNVKTLVGTTSRPWSSYGSNGTTYVTGLPGAQISFETNFADAINPRSGSGAILTDYRSGVEGARLNDVPLQRAAATFLSRLDTVFGASGAFLASARRVNGNIVAHREHWPTNPFSQGSYTCYRPGQFTRFCETEGQPAGNLFFAGEHTSSFHIWQGFMEGACLSGIDAANAIIAAAK